MRTALLVGNIGVLVVLHFLFFTHAESVHILSGLSFALGFFTVSMLISYTWATWLFQDKYTASAVSFTNMIGVIIGGLFQAIIGWLFPVASQMTRYEHAFMLLVVCSVASLVIMLILTYLFKHQPQAQR